MDILTLISKGIIMDILSSPAYLFLSYIMMFLFFREAPLATAKYIGFESPKSEHVFLLFLVSPLSFLFLIWVFCYDAILLGFSKLAKRLFPIKEAIQNEPS